MNTLSRREEQILLSIWHLKDDAYLVGIRKHLSKLIGKNWSVGAIHKPLRILEKLGYVTSYYGEATAKRGGRSKKIYKITEQGMLALSEYKKVNDALWGSFQGVETREG